MGKENSVVVGRKATQTTKKKEMMKKKFIVYSSHFYVNSIHRKTQNDDPFPSHIVNVFSFFLFILSAHFLYVYF